MWAGFGDARVTFAARSNLTPNPFPCGKGNNRAGSLMASFREGRTCAAGLRPRRSLLMHALRLRTRGGYLLARNTPPTDGSESSSRKVMKLLLIDPSSRFTHEPPPGLVSPARTTFLV